LKRTFCNNVAMQFLVLALCVVLGMFPRETPSRIKYNKPSTPRGSTMVLLCIRQEMPALKSTIRGLDGKKVCRSAFQKKVAARLHEAQVATLAGKLRQKTKSSRLPRRSAFHMGRALDYCLSMMGSGLSKFFSKCASVPLLRPGERRYSRQSKRPPPFELPDKVPWKRSCVWNKDTKHGTFDITLGASVDEHPALSIVVYVFVLHKMVSFMCLFCC
jgi:hypothetical protein